MLAFAEKDPAALPWAKLNIDVVIECTGLFLTGEKASAHLKAGAKRVGLSAPPKDADIKTVVLGVNDHVLDGNDEIISNASCTTNCAAPMIMGIRDLCGIEDGFITTVHSYTGDQRTSAYSTTDAADGPITSGTPFVVVSDFASGSSYGTRFNGRPRASQAYSYTTTGTYLELSYSAVPWTGPVHEVIVLDTVPSTDNLRALQEYLARKWLVSITPGPPGTPTVTPGSTQASVSWTAPTWDGGTPVTGYTVTTTATAGTGYGSLSPVTCTAAASPCTLTGLTDGITYSVTVTATNAVGTSAASSAATVTPYPATIMTGSNLKLWLDGADPTTLYASSTCTGAAATTTVGCWKDKSGNTNHATQATSGNRPGLTTATGHSVINLNGSSSYLSLDVSKLPTARATSTLFAVAATTAAGTLAHVVWWGTDSTGAKRTLFNSGSAIFFDSSGSGYTSPGVNWVNGTLTEVVAEAASAATRSAAKGRPYVSPTSYDSSPEPPSTRSGAAAGGFLMKSRLVR